MLGQNFVSVMGHVGQTPELQHTNTKNVPVANINIALNNKWTDRKTGEVRETTTWVVVVCWDGWAKTAAKYVKKGDPVHVEGQLQRREYQDKNGVDRKPLEIVCKKLNLLKPNGTSVALNAPVPTEADMPLSMQAPDAQPVPVPAAQPVPATDVIPG